LTGIPACDEISTPLIYSKYPRHNDEWAEMVSGFWNPVDRVVGHGRNVSDDFDLAQNFIDEKKANR
jgi:hypothetical protein